MASRTRTEAEEDQRSAGSPLALVAAPTAAAPDKPSGSARHALMRGLRLRGNETQLTQAVAALAQSDPRFAREFVRLLLKVAQTDGRHAANVKLMGDPPAGLSCQAEHSVYDEYDYGLGRVDLRFDGGDEFTLFVENKLDSGFGAAAALPSRAWGATRRAQPLRTRGYHVRCPEPRRARCRRRRLAGRCPLGAASRRSRSIAAPVRCALALVRASPKAIRSSTAPTALAPRCQTQVVGGLLRGRQERSSQATRRRLPPAPAWRLR